MTSVEITHPGWMAIEELEPTFAKLSRRERVLGRLGYGVATAPLVSAIVAVKFLPEVLPDSTEGRAIFVIPAAGIAGVSEAMVAGGKQLTKRAADKVAQRACNIAKDLRVPPPYWAADRIRAINEKCWHKENKGPDHPPLP